MTERKPAAPGHASTDQPAAARPKYQLPDHLPRWLEMASRRMARELGATLADSSFPELRGSHRRILQMVPADGIRITDLAAIADMTKQALGEFVDRLEQSGYVVSRRSETDGRVRIVSRTPLGDAAADETERVITSVEQRWRAEIGLARYDGMMAALRELGRDSIHI
jgi:DNA-binding MarR family transcriptional regulator